MIFHQQTITGLETETSASQIMLIIRSHSHVHLMQAVLPQILYRAIFWRTFWRLIEKNCYGSNATSDVQQLLSKHWKQELVVVVSGTRQEISANAHEMRNSGSKWNKTARNGHQAATVYACHKLLVCIPIIPKIAEVLDKASRTFINRRDIMSISSLLTV